MYQRFLPFFTTLIINFILSGWFMACASCSLFVTGSFEEDTIRSNQFLYNGRVWRNLHAAVQGNQFLFSDEFLSGSVTVNGKTFHKLRIKYDILNDEIITITDKGIILQLNREMTDKFTMNFKGREYNFLRLNSDSINSLSGYVNVLYDGNPGLYVKSRKEISGMGPGKNYEDFVQVDRLYLLRDGVIFQLRNKRDFKRQFGDRWSGIKEYKRASGIRLSVKIPDSYVPVLIYLNSLKP